MAMAACMSGCFTNSHMNQIDIEGLGAQVQNEG
jgi:hypothetical protein